MCIRDRCSCVHGSPTPRLAAAAAVVGAINRPNAGILIDTLDFTRAGDEPEELRRLPESDMKQVAAELRAACLIVPDSIGIDIATGAYQPAEAVARVTVINAGTEAADSVWAEIVIDDADTDIAGGAPARRADRQLGRVARRSGANVCLWRRRWWAPRPDSDRDRLQHVLAQDGGAALSVL